MSSISPILPTEELTIATDLNNNRDYYMKKGLDPKFFVEVMSVCSEAPAKDLKGFRQYEGSHYVSITDLMQKFNLSQQRAEEVVDKHELPKLFDDKIKEETSKRVDALFHQKLENEQAVERKIAASEIDRDKEQKVNLASWEKIFAEINPKKAEVHRKYLSIYKNFKMDNPLQILNSKGAWESTQFNAHTLMEAVYLAHELAKYKPHVGFKSFDNYKEGFVFINNDHEGMKIFAIRPLKKLGQGTYGTVEKVVDVSKGVFVAMKSSDVNAKKEWVGKEVAYNEELEREFSLLRSSGNVSFAPNVFKKSLLFQELMDTSLHNYIQDKNRPFNFDERLKICYGLLDDYRERFYLNGLVHRDLKPGNVMCSIDTHGNVRVKIIDLATVMELEDARWEENRSLDGFTPDYSDVATLKLLKTVSQLTARSQELPKLDTTQSSEQQKLTIEMHRALQQDILSQDLDSDPTGRHFILYSQSHDVFALGTILYELLTGHPPPQKRMTEFYLGKFYNRWLQSTDHLVDLLTYIPLAGEIEKYKDEPLFDLIPEMLLTPQKRITIDGLFAKLHKDEGVPLTSIGLLETIKEEDLEDVAL